MNAGEIWRDVPGFEGMYQLSSLGRVRSLKRRSRVNTRIRGRVLKTWRGNTGALVCNLADGDRRRKLCVNGELARLFPEGGTK